MELSEMTQDQLIRRIGILENALNDIIFQPFLVEEKPWTWKDISTKQSEIAQNGLDYFPVDNPVMVVPPSIPVTVIPVSIDDEIPF